MVAPTEIFKYRLKDAFEARQAEVLAVGGRYGLRTAARNIVDRSTPDGVTLEHDVAIESWRRQLQRFMGGEHVPTERVAVQLAEEFGCTVDFLLGETDADANDASSAALMREVAELNRKVDALMAHVGAAA